MNILVTGAAGFIGSSLCGYLLRRGEHVVGVDNLNDYYDPALKEARLRHFCAHDNFLLERVDINDRAAIGDVFARRRPQVVVNLAAQAGVRHSLTHPHAYLDANIGGFLNILEGCRYHEVKHLVYASSSSVYGANTALPFSTGDNVDHPLSLYAATKKSNELMAHAYSHLYGIPTTGLRFFTVYGPWGRPDMALFVFTRKMLAGQPIEVFNHGRHRRDFTYIDDIVEGVVRVIDRPARADAAWSGARPHAAAAPYRLYNIGHGEAVELMRYIELLQEALGVEAVIHYLPMQPGDVPDTNADVADLARDFDYRPTTDVRQGVRRFVKWYRQYYGDGREDSESKDEHRGEA